MIDITRFVREANAGLNRKPFWHSVIDNVLPSELALAVAKEFPAYHDPLWFCYKNKLEDKKALNDWNKYPPTTYRLLTFLNAREFIEPLSVLVGAHLYADIGLHGGGWHIHASGGKLNPHLDYSIHPKMGLQRKLN